MNISVNHLGHPVDEGSYVPLKCQKIYPLHSAKEDHHLIPTPPKISSDSDSTALILTVIQIMTQNYSVLHYSESSQNKLF
jgi:hypothetical protein